ncbi:MAG: hypothetical protein ACTSUT_01025 [Promethearchaeota archaeon]
MSSGIVGKKYKHASIKESTREFESLIENYDYFTNSRKLTVPFALFFKEKSSTKRFYSKDTQFLSKKNKAELINILKKEFQI